ncbi:hypothetical protein AGMMS49574_05540 [Bacteroidia bacterium]|nr:hypothetical protein AGMMS49574_05540 [Bacteroidia bacterium]
MKTEETKLAEEGNENEPENVNGKVNESVNPETQEKQKSSAKKNVAFTAGGVVAGAGSAVAGQFASAYLESDAEESTHTFEHAGTSVAPEAHVSDDLSFGEAFAAARAEVGPGGTFEWHGKEYGTYYKDEWDNMDPGERNQYWASVGLKPHPTDDNQITDQPDANTELLAQEDLEVDGIPEFDESEVDVVALGGEDILDSHDIPVDEVEMSDGEEVLYVDVEETKRIPTSGSAPRSIIPPKPKPKQFPWKPIVAIVSIAAAAFLLFFLLGANSSGIKGPEAAIEMVYVQGGTFSMGCSGEQGSDCYYDEKPLHSVTVSNFNIGKYEVTQAQWKQIMGSNPSVFKGDNLPVENVSWEDVQEFISKLNAATGKRYRLPTEAEWEYAARGGNRSQGYKYCGSNNLNNVAWYWDNSSNKTHPVGAKSPNELGIYDMNGNVYEWCSDWYGNYNSSSQTNPTGPSTGSYRVLRGGSWDDYAEDCRVSDRLNFAPGYRGDDVGFRLVLPL